MKKFNELGQKEVLALAMEIERNNAVRLESLSELYQDIRSEVATFFNEMREEELEHLGALMALWQELHGDELPPVVDEMDISEVIEAVEVEDGEHVLFDDFTLQRAVNAVQRAEVQAEMFYRAAAASTDEVTLKTLFGELAELESTHQSTLADLVKKEVINNG